MMPEEEYLLYLFSKNFELYKHRNIVLYGKGPMTKNVIDKNPDFNIIGIMDRTLERGMIYGKPVISYEDLPYRNVDIIIPIARPESLKMIFNRISCYCERLHIELYSINGNNLFETCDIINENIEEPDFIDVFVNKFRDCWNKKIVLYGNGSKTKRLIDECPEFNFIGIMDKNRKEGMIYNKFILDYKSVLDQKADMIIVIAKPENIPFIVSMNFAPIITYSFMM